MAEYDYDFFVIGGGSGGLAASKAAAELGARTAVADFVKPSPQGTTWGLGGTCVNVGCIPKKLFHYGATAIEKHRDTEGLGWNTEATHDWEKMVQNVGNYIKSINWGYKTELRSKSVKYFNAYAQFVDAHTVELTDKKGSVDRKTAKYILVCCGGRPSLGGYSGAEECCISSDDIFWRKTRPGKTLVVGASYIALECAGFTAAFGCDTTVMVRSILLRGFDQAMATGIGKYMESHGVKFARETVPTRFEKVDEKVKVWAKPAGGGEETEFGVFDTVLMAVGRKGCAGLLNLESAGVQFDAASGKITGVSAGDQTNVENIFAVGDVVQGCPELTPVAIQAGRLLAARLFGGASKLMDYANVPTTVFTPLEYGCIGLSEDEAKEKLGDNAKVYHNYFKPLEWNLNHERSPTDCYVKLIVDAAAGERVVGLHILGPDAGEMVQGFAVAMKAGATKEHFDDTVGIHPTNAEVMTTLADVKMEGVELVAGGGC